MASLSLKNILAVSRLACLSKVVFLSVFLAWPPKYCFAQTDSVVVYYRKFCANYKTVNNSIHAIKHFASDSLVITDVKKIAKLKSKLRRLKKYNRNDGLHSKAFVLGAYSFVNGERQLLFTISTFDRLYYNGSLFRYKDEFLDFLFGWHRECYYF